MTRSRWLWLPAEDGGLAVADPADIPFGIPAGAGPGSMSALRAVNE
jgi:hypothetical protein